MSEMNAGKAGRKRRSLKSSAFLMAMSISLILLAAVFLIDFLAFSRNVDEYYEDVNETLTWLVAESLDPGSVQRLTDEALKAYEDSGYAGVDPEDGSPGAELPEYKELVHRLRVIRDDAEVTYLTMIAADPERGNYIYVADADADPGTGNHFRLPGEIFKMTPEEQAALKEDTEIFPGCDEGVDYQGNKLFTSGSPIPGVGRGTVVFVVSDVEERELREMVWSYLSHVLPLLLALSVVLALFNVFMTERFIVNPVTDMSRAAAEYVNYRRAEGGQRTDFFRRFVWREDGNEIDDLKASMNHMERELNNYIDNLALVAEENARIRGELSVARKIQKDVLPGVFPPFPDRSDISLYATMEPAKEVGGDFYDIILLDDDHLALEVADVSGKGVPAALFMMISKTLIKNVLRRMHSPARTLSYVNNLLVENNREDMFVTVWLAVIELSTGRIVYANAGHENTILCHNGEWEMRKEPHDFILAGVEDTEYTDREYTLSPGDIIFQYTDGVTEAVNGEEEIFGDERLLDACRKAHRENPEEFLGDVRQAMRVFSGKVEQFDDITMLCYIYQRSSHAGFIGQSDTGTTVTDA